MVLEVLSRPLTARDAESVSIDAIVIDKDFMMRDAIDKKTVESYKENLGVILEASPIVVFETPNGLMLVDGFHRLSAARQLNWEQIKVQKYKGSVQDAFAFACLANLKHGKPLMPEERKKAICQYIKLNSKLSNVLIAEHVGKSEFTIRHYRQELIDKGELEPELKTLGKDGKEQAATKTGSINIEVNPFDSWFDERVGNWPRAILET